MAEGREKDLRDQKLQYEEKLKAYNDDAQARQEIEAWNNRRISEIKADWDKKANETAKKTLKRPLTKEKRSRTTRSSTCERAGKKTLPIRS